MRLKRSNVAIVLVCAVVVALIFVISRSPNDPVHNGKRLSEWLVLLVSNSKPWADQSSVEEEASKAVVALGTNALPYLIQAITFDGSIPRPKAAIQWLMIKVPPLEEVGLLHSWAYNVDEAKRAYGSLRAFEILGPKAAPVIPALSRLSHTNSIAYAAVSALGAIGPAAQPALVEFITLNRRSPARSVAIRSLDFGEGAGTNVPMLVECLGDSHATTVRAAVFALGRIKAHSELVVPALINCFKHIQPNQPAAKLSDDQLTLQLEIVSAFGELGQEAHAAVPSLLTALREKNEDDGAACRLIKTLGLIAKEPEPVVPFLVAYLDHTNSWLSHCSVKALAKLGPLARQALPALTNALHHRSGDEWVQYAIQEIAAPMRTNAPPQ